MAFEQRDESGSLFVNDRKEKSTHPDYRGSCKIDGVEYWISGWRKQNDRGTFLSLAFQPKNPKPNNEPKQEPLFRPPADFDDDIPF